jgi:Xaa-Pro aminopeptidase
VTIVATARRIGRSGASIGVQQGLSPDMLEALQGLSVQELGPGELAVSEWQAAGLPLPDFAILRHYRLARIRRYLIEFDYAGIVLYDPLNVRYATDSPNMQIWLMHNASRYVLVPAEGPVILWEFGGCEFMSQHIPVIDEIRSAIPWLYLCTGDRYAEQAGRWAAEIADLVHQYGGGNKRLAIDRCNPEGITALVSHGIEVRNGEQVMELAREIKCAEEIKAMRCAIHACERSMAVMSAHLQPGITEQHLWSYLHAENIKRGGEWIETRLLVSGPRCNPWYQECSSRCIQSGELVAFDTDLIGPYGMCVDISRTWLCGDTTLTKQQRDVYCRAYEQVRQNMSWLRPGLSFHDLTHQSLQYDPEQYHRYGCLYHGVGLCDETPFIYFPDVWDTIGYDGVLKAGMVICVESHVGSKSGGPGVKLEEQVLITKDGYECLSSYPLAIESILDSIVV